MTESGTEQPVWEKYKIRAWVSTVIITVVVIGYKSVPAKRFCHVRVNVSLSHFLLDLTPCERSSGRDCKLCSRPVSLKEENKQSLWLVWSHRLTLCNPRMSNCGLQKDDLLHSWVGYTADVTGNHHQAGRMEACHHRSQIDLEPQLKVFRLKVFKFRSKGRQGQVQHGVSYIWISEEGDVSLEIKGFMLEFRGTF